MNGVAALPHQGLLLAMLDVRGTDAAVRRLWDAWIERFVHQIGHAIANRRAVSLVEDYRTAAHTASA